MCGIYFCYCFDDGRYLEPDRFGHSLTHRGPDAFSMYSDGRVCLKFYRLAVMDKTATGMQPKHHQGIWSMVNGEFWNYQSLAKQFNIPLEGCCDSQILLPLYEKNKLDQLDGEYVYLIYDSNTNHLHLGTDLLSSRPLFIDCSDTRIEIASEIKELQSGLDIVRLPSNIQCSLDLNKNVHDQLHGLVSGWKNSLIL